MPPAWSACRCVSTTCGHLGGLHRRPRVRVRTPPTARYGPNAADPRVDHDVRREGVRHDERVHVPPPLVGPVERPRPTLAFRRPSRRRPGTLGERERREPLADRPDLDAARSRTGSTCDIGPEPSGSRSSGSSTSNSDRRPGSSAVHVASSITAVSSTSRTSREPAPARVQQGVDRVGRRPGPQHDRERPRAPSPSASADGVRRRLGSTRTISRSDGQPAGRACRRATTTATSERTAASRPACSPASGPSPSLGSFADDARHPGGTVAGSAAAGSTTTTSSPTSARRCDRVMQQRRPRYSARSLSEPNRVEPAAGEDDPGERSRARPQRPVLLPPLHVLEPEPALDAQVPARHVVVGRRASPSRSRCPGRGPRARSRRRSTGRSCS